MTSPVQPHHDDEPGLVEPEGVQSSAEPPPEDAPEPEDGPTEAEVAQSDEMLDRPEPAPAQASEGGAAEITGPGQELAAGEG